MALSGHSTRGHYLILFLEIWFSEDRFIRSLKSQREAYVISTCLRAIINISSFPLVILFSGFDDFLMHFYYLFIYLPS